MIDPSTLPFRPCVGIALFNDAGKVFLGERVDQSGSWQLPQGGVDEGEDIERAFFREMKEEIGTDKATIIRIHNKPLRYRFPAHLIGGKLDGRYAGQEQRWIAARFTGVDSDIRLDAHDPPEFQAWKWAKLASIINSAVSFKRDTYIEVIRAFHDLAEVHD